MCVCVLSLISTKHIFTQPRILGGGGGREIRIIEQAQMTEKQKTPAIYLRKHFAVYIL